MFHSRSPKGPSFRRGLKIPCHFLLNAPRCAVEWGQRWVGSLWKRPAPHRNSVLYSTWLNKADLQSFWSSMAASTKYIYTNTVFKHNIDTGHFTAFQNGRIIKVSKVKVVIMQNAPYPWQDYYINGSVLTCQQCFGAFTFICAAYLYHQSAALSSSGHHTHIAYRWQQRDSLGLDPWIPFASVRQIFSSEVKTELSRLSTYWLRDVLFSLWWLPHALAPAMADRVSYVCLKFQLFLCLSVWVTLKATHDKMDLVNKDYQGGW